VPVWCVEVKEDEEELIHLALNNHAGDWQWQPVSVQLKAIKERGQEVKLSGFHEYDIQPLLAAEWKPAELGTLEGGDPGQQTLL